MMPAENNNDAFGFYQITYKISLLFSLFLNTAYNSFIDNCTVNQKMYILSV